MAILSRVLGCRRPYQPVTTRWRTQVVCIDNDDERIASNLRATREHMEANAA